MELVLVAVEVTTVAAAAELVVQGLVELGVLHIWISLFQELALPLV